MGSFHEELVARRRAGEAPAQQSAEPEREADLLVNFYPAPFEGLSTCGRCLALVVTEYTPSHGDWHRQIGA